MSNMTTAQEKGIFKAAVVVHDEAGLPNYDYVLHGAGDL